MDKFWIVASTDFPTRISYRHPSIEEADTEALRLSNQTGKDFYVLELVAVYTTTKTITKQVVDGTVSF
jgi:hypothetical protein